MQKTVNSLTLLRYIWDPGRDDFLGKQKLPKCKKRRLKQVSKYERNG